MKVSKVNKLQTLLDSNPLGQLYRINWIDSIQCKTINRALASEFLNTWMSKAYTAESWEEFSGSIRTCKQSEERFQHSSGISLEHTITKDTPLYTVMQYNRRRGLCANLEAKDSILATANNICDIYANASEQQWPDLEKELMSLGKIDVKMKLNQSLKSSPEKVIWFSTSEPGEVLKEEMCCNLSGSSRADTARETLGLIHIKSGNPPPLLVALEIIADDLPQPLKIWRPTPIDAEDHTRFRGAFGDLHKTASEWGRAIHLQALSDDIGKLGAPEAVTPNFRPKPGTMRLWFLGYPRIPIDDGAACKDKQFVDNVARGRSIKEINDRFIALC